MPPPMNSCSSYFPMRAGRSIDPSLLLMPSCSRPAVDFVGIGEHGDRKWRARKRVDGPLEFDDTARLRLAGKRGVQLEDYFFRGRIANAEDDLGRLCRRRGSDDEALQFRQRRIVQCLGEVLVPGGGFELLPDPHPRRELRIRLV